MSARPTPGQLEAIDYFASVVDGEKARPGRRANFAQSMKACVRQGWLEPINVWPYHAPTDAGRAVLADAERAS